jgi:hypothetical protein
MHKYWISRRLLVLRLKWINRHFTREINAQIRQYRMYKKLLDRVDNADDQEFYAYEMEYYRNILANRVNIDPEVTKRHRVR